MKVLSLFDGMSCGMIAFKELGIELESYDAYEIDSYAIKTSEHNFPNIKHHGDVFKADFTKYDGCDFVIGGSPCTYWSIAQQPGKRETTASGFGWELFQQYVRAIKEAKPKYFLYENNKSMSNDIRESICDTFGFEPILVDSALVSAQHRERLYWCGIRQEDGTYAKAAIKQPKDLGIVMKDILESGTLVNPIKSNEDKSHALVASYAHVGLKLDGSYGGDRARPKVIESIGTERVGDLPNKGGKIVGTQGKRVYSVDGKGCCACAGIGTNKPQYAIPIAPSDRLERVGTMPSDDGDVKYRQGNRIYSECGKGCTQTANGGGLGGNTGLYAINVPETITRRKNSGDVSELKKLLIEHKNITCREIAEKLNTPKTQVEHWFRNDESFSIPPKEVWFDLKKLLNISTTEWDSFVTEFVECDGVYDTSQRCYGESGKMATLTTSGSGKAIVNVSESITEIPPMRVKENTKKGYIDVESGECVDLDFQNSKTRKGRMMREKSNCLKTSNEYYQYLGTTDSPVYTVRDGEIEIKGKYYPIKLKDGKYIIRKLTVNECARLQTVPEWFEFPVSNTQAYKQLGNGWTVNVIKHLLNGLLSNKVEKMQQKLF